MQRGAVWSTNVRRRRLFPRVVGMQAPLLTFSRCTCQRLAGIQSRRVARDRSEGEPRARARGSAEFATGFPRIATGTVNLAPADLPKESGRFDLPIALGILAATAQIPEHRLRDYEFAGELALSGELRPVRGALAMTLKACGDGRAFILPSASAA